MSPLPPFNVASSLIQHPGIHYPPIHYAQLPSTSLQFAGLRTAFPYAVPPNFLPRSPPFSFCQPCHLSPSTLCAICLTPWQKEPLLPQASSPAHSFSKPPPVAPYKAVATSLSTQPLDLAPGRMPIYYQMSRLPAGYTLHETAPAGANPVVTPQEGPACSGSSRCQWTETARSEFSETEAKPLTPLAARARARELAPVAECVVDGQLFSGSQSARVEVAVPATPRTPDTDLEVQRVVGALASQDYRAVAIRGRMSPVPSTCPTITPDHQGGGEASQERHPRPAEETRPEGSPSPPPGT